MTTNTHPPHRRTVRLPLGCRVTFRFAPETGLACEWHPGLPRIESPRAWLRFFIAYTTERDRFLAEAATMIGGAMLVADVKGGRITGATTIRPAVRQ